MGVNEEVQKMIDAKMAEHLTWYHPTPPTTPPVTPPVTPPPVVTPPVGNNPSGTTRPKDDEPGFKLAMFDDFDIVTAKGSWGAPNKVPAPYLGRFKVYDDGWLSTNGGPGGRRIYEPSTVLQTRNGCMEWNLWTGGSPIKDHAAAVEVGGYQSGGIYKMAFRADRLGGYKIANLLWPNGNWPANGEIDWPEGDFDETIDGFMHRQNATQGSDQDILDTNATFQDWHIGVTKWKKGQFCEFWLDGVMRARYTNRVPAIDMRWVMQVEASLDASRAAPSGAKGNFYVDWVALYQPA